MCAKGVYCLYAHAENERGHLPPDWVCKHLAENRKTELCPYDRCQQPDCQYAHSPSELGKEKPKRTKTKLCRSMWQRNGTMSCKFGRYCEYAHGEHEVGKPTLEWKMKLCETWKQNNGCCRAVNCPDAHGVEMIAMLRKVSEPPSGSRNDIVEVYPADAHRADGSRKNKRKEVESSRTPSRRPERKSRRRERSAAAAVTTDRDKRRRSHSQKVLPLILALSFQCVQTYQQHSNAPLTHPPNI